MTQQQTDNGDRQETTLGELLRMTREAHGKSLEEAATTTRIHVNFLRALEENNFEKLPAEIFTRGFIRLYATYLGLDPDDTFQHYLSQEKIDRHKPTAKPFHQDIVNSELLDRTSIFIKKTSKVLPVTFLLLIMIIFYILGIFFKSEEQSAELHPEIALTDNPVNQAPPAPADLPLPPADLPPPQIADEPGPAAEAALPKPPVKAGSPPRPTVKTETVTPDQPPARPAPKPEPPPPPSTVAQPLEPVKTFSQPVTVKVATESPVEPTGSLDADFKYVLEARFEEGSRVSIKVDDQPQRQYASQAGIVRVWKARESIVLNLDNRAGVSLTLNGKPLSVKGTDGPTATINIPADLPNVTQP